MSVHMSKDPFAALILTNAIIFRILIALLLVICVLTSMGVNISYHVHANPLRWPTNHRRRSETLGPHGKFCRKQYDVCSTNTLFAKANGSTNSQP